MLKRICPIKYGYDNKFRKITIEGFVGNLWNYGSTIFAHTLTQQKNKEIIRKYPKKALLPLTESYRTTSYLPLTVISNTITLDYQVTNRTVTYLSP